MNFNIYVNKDLGKRVTRTAKAMQRSRNSIITEALEEWMNNHSSNEWPKDFFEFKPIKDVPDFKALRKNLVNNRPEDPLA